MADIKKLVSQMTLEEKAGLLSGKDFWHTKAVERLGVPEVMVSDGPHGLRKQALEVDHLGVNESIKAVCFPAGCATAASFDRDAMKKLGETLGDECQHEELSVILGPAMNIKRSPLCGRNFEYLSEDPYLAGEIATAYTKAVQSKNVGVSCKHFALNSQEHRRMSSDSRVDERTLREIYLPAFENAVKNANPWTIMCSYNRVNGVLASENKRLLTDILRGDWGFKGYVMSDWGAVSERVDGVKAGLDLEMPGSNGMRDKLIVEAVKSGKLDEKLVDLSCERILDVCYRYIDNAKPETPWDKDADDVISGALAEQCMVLLKNEGDILPLTKGDPIAFIGEFAEKPRFQGGGSSHINCTKVTSALDAAAGIPNISYAKGFNIDDDSTSDELIAEAVAKAAAAKVAVLFIGLPDAYESEGYDRKDMKLPECQNKLIAAVCSVNPNTVVVLHNGSPVELPWLCRVKGLLEAYLGGQAAGRAVVRLLFGDANPCGKLAETFPIKLEDNPSYLNFGGDMLGTDYREGIFVGYRYYDKKKMNVQFPFGYGLSYTSFAYDNLRISADEITDKDKLSVSVDVTNTGKRAGKEIVQLYIANPQSDSNRPVRELRGFEKVALEPGQTKTVCFELCSRAFSYFEPRISDWYAESGEYGVEIGRSSREIVLCSKLKLKASSPLPIVFDRNSVFLDIMSTEKGRAITERMMASTMSGFIPDGEGGEIEQAVTTEMMEAMIGYMPLRSLLSFAGGRMNMDYDAIDAIVDELNKK